MCRVCVSNSRHLSVFRVVNCITSSVPINMFYRYFPKQSCLYFLWLWLVLPTPHHPLHIYCRMHIENGIIPTWRWMLFAVTSTRIYTCHTIVVIYGIHSKTFRWQTHKATKATVPFVYDMYDANGSNKDTCSAAWTVTNHEMSIAHTNMSLLAILDVVHIQRFDSRVSLFCGFDADIVYDLGSKETLRCIWRLWRFHTQTVPRCRGRLLDASSCVLIRCGRMTSRTSSWKLGNWYNNVFHVNHQNNTNMPMQNKPPNATPDNAYPSWMIHSVSNNMISGTATIIMMIIFKRRVG